MKAEKLKLGKSKKIATWLLYLLPVVFFAICYFLLTATEEDIAQGAGTTPEVWKDLVAGFRYNARLADMYAWAVINFFDYQYSFGVDTIFRLIDLLAVTGLLVLLTSVILGRRPRLKLKDASVFMGCFLMLVLTPYGYTLYRGFSMIHNYLIIALAMVGFCLPFMRKASGGVIPKFYRKWWVAIPMGLVFGMSANFPPLAFLATYIVVKVGQFWKIKRRGGKYVEMRPEAWEWMMIGGMLVSMTIGYVFGPGLSNYASDPMYVTVYDYVKFGDIFQNFGGSVVRILKHMVMNFARTLAPVVAVLVGGFVVALLRAKQMGKKLIILPEDKGQRNLLLILAVSAGFAVLAGSQIIMPVRLCLPAYLALMIATMILLRAWFYGLGSRGLGVVTVLMILVAVATIVIRTVFAWDFHERVGEALAMIRDAEGDTVCVNQEELQQRPKMPFGMFQQEETFVLRQENNYIIYGKSVGYCSRMK